MSDLRASEISAPTYRQGVVLVLAAAFFISTMGLGVRLMEVATLWQILFYRSISLAVLLYVAIARAGGRTPMRAIRDEGASGVIGAIALVVAFSGGIAAIQLTSVANAMLLFATAPFMAALIGFAVLREAVRRATMIAMAVSLIGVAIMVSGSIAQGSWLGNAAALLQALGFAVFATTLRWRKSEDTLSAVQLGAFLSILVAGTMCIVTGQSFVLSTRDLGLSLALGVFQIGVGLLLFSRGSQAVPAGELALLAMAEVILAPLWVWVLLGETASLSTVTGGAILLLALAGNAISGMQEQGRPGLPS
jgi:drug/metabolite transporter (DMT)-like permease